ncbi:MAG: transcription termination/antitermination protein NusG, partial [Nocardioides sp.]
MSETDQTDSQTNDVTEHQVSEQYTDQAETASLEDQPTAEAETVQSPTDDAVDETPAADEATATEAGDVAETATDEVADTEAGEETEGATDVADDDPLEAFRNELWAKPGDWFVIHTYSGMEKRVKSNLENRINSLNMEDYIHE